MGERSRWITNRRDGRQVTKVSYIQGGHNSTADRPDNATTSRDVSQSNSRMCALPVEHDNATSGGDKQGRKSCLVAVAVICAFLVMILGALSLGGVALYHIHFDSPIDTYQVFVQFQDATIKLGMTLPNEPGYSEMDKRFCKWMYAVFGDELKFCEVDFLFSVKHFGVVTGGRLHFFRRRLKTAANEAHASLKYIEDRLTYGRYTKFIWQSIYLEQLATRESYIVTSNFSSAATQVQYRNDTNYYVAQKSVCDTIKIALAKVYMSCYIAPFETKTGSTSIHLDVEANELRDELQKDPVKIYNISNAETTLSSILKKLINKNEHKIGFFDDTILKVE